MFRALATGHRDHMLDLGGELGTEATEATATGDALDLGAEFWPSTWATPSELAMVEHSAEHLGGDGHRGEYALDADDLGSELTPSTWPRPQPRPGEVT